MYFFIFPICFWHIKSTACQPVFPPSSFLPHIPKWKSPACSPPPAFPPSSLSLFSFFPFSSYFVPFFTISDLDTLLSLLLVAPNPPAAPNPRERESVLVVRGRPAPKPWLLCAVRASSTAAWKQFQFLFCTQRLVLRKSLSRPILPCSIVGWSIS